MGAEPDIQAQAAEHRSEPPGKRLRAGREAAGLTLEQAGAQLRLAPEVIEALEGDDFSRLPPPIFVRGYVRSYATELGLPADELVDAYTDAVGGDHAPSLSRTGAMQTQVRSGDARMRWATYLISVVLIVLVALWLYNHEFRAPADRPAVPAGSEAPAAATAPASEAAPSAPTPEVSAAASQPQPAAPTPTSQAQPAAAPAPEVEATPAAPAAPAAEAPSTPAASPAPAAAGQTLQLSFSGTCWVEVRDAKGKRLLTRLAKAGEQVTVNGKAPFQLLLGNAPVASIRLDGKPFDATPFVQGKVSRFQVK
jgi:cytoskeleton protein RodZ